jgi:hypothetical protein
MLLCNLPNCACSSARAASIASMIPLSSARPEQSSRTRASKPLRITTPIFSPKPRKRPRMLNSTLSSLPSNSLRATSSALISRAPGDLQWTGRYQPMRRSCAMPRASLRSVFTVIADKAALTCRVSSRAVSKPASVSPACSHCDSGPASSPTRSIETPSPRKKPTSASGSLVTFASRMMAPLASTTQTLESSRETSIPA